MYQHDPTLCFRVYSTTLLQFSQLLFCRVLRRRIYFFGSILPSVLVGHVCSNSRSWGIQMTFSRINTHTIESLNLPE